MTNLSAPVSSHICREAQIHILRQTHTQNSFMGTACRPNTS
jgi:hypothetical protein